MDRIADAASFTGTTLAWFDEGEQIAASERDLAAERVEERGRGRLLLAIVLLLALLGFAAVMAAPYFGYQIELPWAMPWE